jgi:hypothetical protein
MEGGEIGLAVEGEAGPLVSKGKALELLEKVSVAEDARQGEVRGMRKIDLENSDAPESQPWERPLRRHVCSSPSVLPVFPMIVPSVFSPS